MAFRRICAWCQSALDLQSAAMGAEVPITHGICQSCLRNMRLERTVALDDFLERLAGPVALVSKDGVFQAANARAYEVAGKEPSRVLGRRGGEVIECLYADLPGGCGASEHCRTGCVIRRSVAHTQATGEAVVEALAAQQVHTPEGDQIKRFVISTERVGELVLLRIDEDA